MINFDEYGINLFWEKLYQTYQVRLIRENTSYQNPARDPWPITGNG